MSTKPRRFRNGSGAKHPFLLNKGMLQLNLLVSAEPVLPTSWDAPNQVAGPGEFASRQMLQLFPTCRSSRSEVSACPGTSSVNISDITFTFPFTTSNSLRSFPIWKPKQRDVKPYWSSLSLIHQVGTNFVMEVCKQLWHRRAAFNCNTIITTYKVAIKM